MTKLIDLSGQRFGRLVVKARVFSEHSKGTVWACVCDCGNHVQVVGGNLKSGNSKSCGCFDREMVSLRFWKHGDSKNGKSAEYRTWSNLKDRCSRQNNKHFNNYGGRGIVVCNRWLNSFVDFLADVGPRPSCRYSLDRIDNDGNYEPGNVRWATDKEQSNNRRTSVFYEFKGERLTNAQWAERLGLKPVTLWVRVHTLGWSIEKALTTPSKKSMIA